MLGTITNELHTLFLYVLVLDIGVVLLSRWKTWHALMYGSFCATVFVYLVWFASSYREEIWSAAQVYALLFFAIFLVVSLSRLLHKEKNAIALDYGLFVLNPAFFFGVTYLIIQPLYPEWMGLITAVLGVFYLLVAYAVRVFVSGHQRFRHFAVGVAFVFFVLAVPIQFESFLMTIGWGAEALAATYLGCKLNARNLRVAGAVLYGFTTFRLLVFDSMFHHGVDEPWVNTRFITFLISLVLFALGYLAIRTFREQHEEGNDSSGAFATSLLLASLGAPIWAISVEIVQFFDNSYLSVVWPIAAVAAGGIGITLKNMAARIASIGLFLIAGFRLLAAEVPISGGAEPWLNVRVLLFALAVISSLLFSLLYAVDRHMRQERTEYGGATALLSIYAYILTLIFISLEIGDFYHNGWLPVAWSVLGCIALCVALWAQHLSLRVMVYLTFAVTVIRLLTVDTAVDVTVYDPLINMRVLAFIVSILALAFGALMLSRYHNGVRDTERRIMTPALASVATGLGFWVMSAEVLDFFNQRLASVGDRAGEQRETLENMQRVALSVSWIMYAVGMLVHGIIRRARATRIAAIVLFAVIILKIFLYDTANLDNLYRFVSYGTLGVILLIVGFLYNRFRERITEFIQGADVPKKE